MDIYYKTKGALQRRGKVQSFQQMAIKQLAILIFFFFKKRNIEPPFKRLKNNFYPDIEKIQKAKHQKIWKLRQVNIFMDSRYINNLHKTQKALIIKFIEINTWS